MSEHDDPLSHYNAKGEAHMVSVSAKPETPREAIAQAVVRMQPETLTRIREGQASKGDVLAVARLAAIGGAKNCALQIPLCHPVRITAVDVEIELDEALPGVRIRARVSAQDRTGPEMEAMMAASVGALTVYDMCKAMDRAMEVQQVCLLEKRGGKSGHWTRPA